MKLFYECNFFNEEFHISDNFTVQQNELVLLERYSNGKNKFSKVIVNYDCQWHKQDDWTHRPTILIPIRDNLDLLKITLKNLKDNNIDTHCNVIIIDDRSLEDVKLLTIENGFSYLRIDNPKGFNFSMLNNIPAKICHILKIETIILWNSDLWCAKEEWFLELLKRHHENSSQISGSKLIYPPEEMSIRNEIDTQNIHNHFPNMINGKWRNTVQFGGACWVKTPGPVEISPIHHKRFSEANNHITNSDKGTSFVTGALQVIDLNWFISVGGMNPTLSKVFQDVDLCLKAIQDNKKVYYFGKNIYFYHDESATLNNISNEKKIDNQYISDHIIFGNIWNKHIRSLIW